MIIGIVAIAENGAIGKDNKLPWHYSADLKFFKRTTIQNIVAMGSKTWRSIGKPLPDRQNVVLSRSERLELPDGVIHLRSKKELTDLAMTADSDVFIIGGAEVFSAFRDVIDRWLVTRIPENVSDADTFMPPDLFDGFEETEQIDLGEGLRVSVLDKRPQGK